MNNDYLNLHLHDQMSGWLRYCSHQISKSFRIQIKYIITPRRRACRVVDLKISNVYTTKTYLILDVGDGNMRPEPNCKYVMVL